MGEIDDNLIARFVTGNASDAERGMLEERIHSDPKLRAEVERLRRLWLAAPPPEPGTPDFDAAWLDLVERIDAPAKPKVHLWRWAAAIFLVAGLISLLIVGIGAPQREMAVARVPASHVDTLSPDTVGAAAVVSESVNEAQPLKAPRKAIATIAVRAGDSALVFVLPDSTRVFLNRNSKLTYPERFAAARREVHLSGEAFFEVSKGKGEFFVYCQEARVRVLGTSFNVNGYEPRSPVIVSVETGLVEVSGAKSHEITLLRPGQQGTFDPAQATVSIGKADKKGWWKRNGFGSRIRRFINRITRNEKPTSK